MTAAGEQRSRLMGMADRMRDQTHWEILGVGEDATEEEDEASPSQPGEEDDPEGEAVRGTSWTGGTVQGAGVLDVPGEGAERPSARE